MKEKILLVDQYNKIGGGQSVLINLINSFNLLGFDCTVAIPQGGYIESQVNNLNFHYLPGLKLTNEKKTIFDSLKLVFHYVGILSLVKKVRESDIIYVNGPRYFIFFYLISFFIRRKFIYHAHLDFSNAGKFVLKLLYKQSNTFALVFTSHFLSNRFSNYIGLSDTVPNKKSHVIEPGLAEKYETLKFNDRLSNNKHLFNFVSVGRVYPGKGFDLIVETAKIYNDYQFYIVGNPVEDSLTYYESLKNNAPANVHFIKASDNIPQLVEKYNIHFAVVPSDLNEAFGIVATELMMCSCITFVRNRGGLKEISVNTGAILFEDRNALIKAIAEAVAALEESKSDLAFKQYTNTKKSYNSAVFTEKLRNLLSA
jgi:UDP-N-acetylglucosamine:(glucosyl)LPS alpha-1,2-N-acetylglucosaminyltransferase